MKNNEIIPIENDSALIVYKKPKKRLFKILFFVVISITVIIICLNYNDLSAFFVSINDSNNQSDYSSNSSTDTSTNTATSTNSDTSADSSISAAIPNGSHQILEGSFNFTQISNNTSYEIGALEYSPKKAQEIYKKYGDEAPVALIIHSACKESYSNGVYYSTSDDFYSSNENVKEIGKFIASELTSLGINTIHIDGIFKNGALYSSKEEYENALSNALKEYPSIEYVFDISRDVLINDDLSMVKPICIIDGNKAAQAKIWVGTSNNSELWKKNLSLATMIGATCPELVYDVVLSSFSYSYELCPTFLKIDIGAFSNTYNEAMLLSKALSTKIADLIR